MTVFVSHDRVQCRSRAGKCYNPPHMISLKSYNLAYSLAYRLHKMLWMMLCI